MPTAAIPQYAVFGFSCGGRGGGRRRLRPPGPFPNTFSRRPSSSACAHPRYLCPLVCASVAAPDLWIRLGRRRTCTSVSVVTTVVNTVPPSSELVVTTVGGASCPLACAASRYSK